MSLISYARDNKAAVIAGGTGLALGAVVGAGTVAALGGSSSRKSKKRKSTRSRKKTSKRRNKRKYYPEPRGKRYSRRKIRTTKSGQPYIILASGKARFISKRSARISKRRKGGKY